MVKPCACARGIGEVDGRVRRKEEKEREEEEERVRASDRGRA